MDARIKSARDGFELIPAGGAPAGTTVLLIVDDQAAETVEIVDRGVGLG